MENIIGLKKTSLTHIHEKLGAKMSQFAGYYMPIQYKGVITEHETVRSGVGVFDVSHMGEFFLYGEKALDLIQKITTNDACKLDIGCAQYSCMPNDKGGIVDDLLVYRLEEQKYMLVVNASNIEKDWNWISSYNDSGVKMENKSDYYTLLAVQGPHAIQVLQKLTKIDLAKMKYYTFETADFAGSKNVILSATGYTGSGGFEIYVNSEDAELVWNEIFKAGEEQLIKPIGLAARDTLRLEMGYCLYGNDIDETTSPIEAGLGWITKFTKNFINKEEILRQKNQGVSRKLVAFEVIGKGIPRKGYNIVDNQGIVIGKVTSGTMSPSIKKAIGLGYVNIPYEKIGTEILIQLRKKNIVARVVKLPFYKV